MISAFVLLNCHFPLDSRIKQELSKMPFVSMIHRTEGRYDLILKVDAETEDRINEKILNEIGTVRGVDSTISLVIGSKKK